MKPKPSRWAIATGSWGTSDGRGGSLQTIRWSRREGIDLTTQAYYRSLCAHYIGEARRWHKVALKSPEVQQAYEVLVWSHYRPDAHPMDDAE